MWLTLGPSFLIYQTHSGHVWQELCFFFLILTFYVMPETDCMTIMVRTELWKNIKAAGLSFQEGD